MVPIVPSWFFINLKRFDIPASRGGVNRLCPPAVWGPRVIEGTQAALPGVSDAQLVFFLPEAHILPALGARRHKAIAIGCQGVSHQDTSIGGPFGAFTTQRTANAMAAIGCEWTIIGHCEERQAYRALGMRPDDIERVLGDAIRRAQEAGLKVVYCVGEAQAERGTRETVLAGQLHTALHSGSREGIVLAYEPVWAIGPGKQPPGREDIAQSIAFLHKQSDGLPIVYGGGLKRQNAAMLASIPHVSGGLIALTRFEGEIGFYPEELLAIIDTYEGRPS